MSKILSTSDRSFITTDTFVIRIPTFNITPAKPSVEVATTDIPFDIRTPTWEHFVNSSYNADNKFLVFTASSTDKYIMYYKDTTHVYTVYTPAAVKVKPDDIIIEDNQYFLSD